LTAGSAFTKGPFTKILLRIFLVNRARNYTITNTVTKWKSTFLFVRTAQAVAVEVKSAGNTKSKSIGKIIANYVVKHGIKFSPNNVSISGSIDSFPLYMAMFL
jgi:hypothetical protein